jgi:ABC-type transporter Mla maintaining outer membrane lipid asymmetry ATPase subunit MlaF
MLHEGEIRAFGTPNEVAQSQDPWVRRFVFAGTEQGRSAAMELGLAL